MLKSLRARNIALMTGMLFLGQLLTLMLVGVFVIEPQADRVATILSRNVLVIGQTLDALPVDERTRFIARVNTAGPYRIQPGVGEPPGIDGRPTWLERRVLWTLADDLGQRETMVWRGGGRAPLWVRMRIGAGDVYWVSLAPSPGWTPTGALIGAIVVALVLSLASGLALQRRINTPLTRLADAVDAIPDTRDVEVLAQNAPAEIASLASAFERMAARIATQEADRSFMLAGISHDLKTPIAKLRLAAALREMGDGEDSMIARQFDRIERMLDQFLDFGRGTESEAPRSINVRAVVTEAAAALGLNSAIVSGASHVTALLRPIAFERALTNIMRNAIAHGRDPVTIRIEEAPSHVAIIVSDCGDGVDPAQIDELARPFFRGNEARPSDGAAGLGLAIVKRFAAEHGGALILSNLSPGFQVTLSLLRDV
jgi:two-component system, OmpR family, osmolarity sensor histidine kinase EnvZ